MDGLYHQNQSGQHLEQHLELQIAIIQAHMDLTTPTGLLRTTIRAALITRSSTTATSASAMCTATSMCVSPRLSNFCKIRTKLHVMSITCKKFKPKKLRKKI